MFSTVSPNLVAQPDFTGQNGTASVGGGEAAAGTCLVLCAAFPPHPRVVCRLPASPIVWQRKFLLDENDIARMTQSQRGLQSQQQQLGTSAGSGA